VFLLHFTYQLVNSAFLWLETRLGRFLLATPYILSNIAHGIEHRAYIKIAVLRGRNAREFCMEGHCSSHFPQLTVAFSSISPSQYGYFDVDTVFYSSHIHSARLLTYNWVSISLCVTTVVTAQRHSTDNCRYR
jgi:hypothetical protein